MQTHCIIENFEGDNILHCYRAYGTPEEEKISRKFGNRILVQFSDDENEFLKRIRVYDLEIITPQSPLHKELKREWIEDDTMKRYNDIRHKVIEFLNSKKPYKCARIFLDEKKA